MVLYVGRKVICVNASKWPTPRQFGNYTPILPKQGAVYTVRDLVPKGAFLRGTFEGPAEDGLHLVEIINPLRWNGVRKVELAFRMSRFKPLRATNIDVFKTMLEPMPAYELVGWATAPARDARQGAQEGR